MTDQGEGICYCGNPTEWNRDKFRPYCSAKCSNNSPLKKSATRRTLISRYGVSHPSKLEWVKDKKRKTSLRNYGVEHPLRSEEVRKRMMNTNMRRRGVPWVMQDPEVLKKSKQSAFGSTEIEVRGRRLLVQGYERRVVEDLQARRSVSEISTDAPFIEYGTSSVRMFDPDHRYFPDLLVKKGKSTLIIEVKSRFTLDQHYERNMSKFHRANFYCQEMDFEFVLAVVAHGRVWYLRTPTHKRIQHLYRCMDKAYEKSRAI